ncbi:MAG: tetratricopeptide repeat protein [Bacteroidales bacterium]|nr:tetratricopeptide repeat protein [Bacteroidales bacterium]
MKSTKNWHRHLLVFIFVTGIIISGNVFAGDILSGDGDDPVRTGQKYGSDSATCVMNLSLYYEFYKQWKQNGYKGNAVHDAIGPWRWVYNNCPESSGNVYVHGIKIMDFMIENEPNKENKEMYIDTLMMIYDQRIKYFGKEGYNLGRKGVDLYKLRPTAYEEAYNILKKSTELEQNNTQGPALIYYFRAAEKLVKAGKADTIILVDIFDKSSEIIEYNLDKYKEDKENQKKLVNWENIKGNIELSFEPYGTCEIMINIYTAKYDETPDNIELLKKITKVLDKKDCTNSKLFFMVTESLHKAQPTAKSAYLMGKMYIKKEDYSSAASYLKEATSLFEDPEDKADAHFLLANVYFQQKKYSAARGECYNVIKIRPNDGKSYMLIGDLYASSANSCGDDEIAKKSPYWAAVDKYQKARNVDSEVASEARKRINTYSQHFPLKERLFFFDLQNGDSYKVECWINENTTIRSSD